MKNCFIRTDSCWEMIYFFSWCINTIIVQSVYPDKCFELWRSKCIGSLSDIRCLLRDTWLSAVTGDWIEQVVNVPPACIRLHLSLGANITSFFQSLQILSSMCGTPLEISVPSQSAVGQKFRNHKLYKCHGDAVLLTQVIFLPHINSNSGNLGTTF